MKCSALLLPISCAGLFCLANALKPAVIDDTAYLWYARQIAQSPDRPFGPPPDGFTLIWYDRSQPAFTLLTPLVVPYWLGLGFSFIGENLFLLKLWLFPFCLIFCLSLQSLLRRFTPGLEKKLLVLTVFSPVFLPSLNVMVDVPAVALNLLAIAVFCHALDRPQTRWSLVILGGLIAGLAAQTKYTGATAIVVLVLYGISRRRWFAGVTAGIIAIAFFVGWEAVLSDIYGRSHFLYQLEKQRKKPLVAPQSSAVERWKTEISDTIQQKAGMTVPLMGYLGGLGLAFIPLMLLAVRRSLLTVRRIALGLLGLFLLMAFLPGIWARWYWDSRTFSEVSVSTVFLGGAGIMFAILLAECCVRLGWKRTHRIRHSFASWFLIGWLAIEIGAYFVLSPFAAARRVMGIFVVTTLIMGRLLTTETNPQRRYLAGVYGVASVALGLFFFWTDYRDAIAERDALHGSVRLIRESSGGARPIWFTGHWGFQYYGERAGLRTVQPFESVIEEGDWIFIPDLPPRPYAQPIALEPDWAEKRFVLEMHELWPLRTNPDYYDGYVPIRRHDGQRLRIMIFQAKKRFLAEPF